MCVCVCVCVCVFFFFSQVGVTSYNVRLGRDVLGCRARCSQGFKGLAF